MNMKRILLLSLLFPCFAFAEPANIDLEIAVGEDSYVTITFMDLTGDPEDISADSFYFAAIATWSSDTLSVAPAAFTKSCSGLGLGVIDTISMKISDTDSDIAPGFYTHALGRVFADGDKELVARGAFLVTNDASPLGW